MKVIGLSTHIISIQCVLAWIELNWTLPSNMMGQHEVNQELHACGISILGPPDATVVTILQVWAENSGIQIQFNSTLLHYHCMIE